MVNTYHYRVRQGQANTAAQQGPLTNIQGGSGGVVKNNINDSSSSSRNAVV
jgi:hypothetical protein